ncbi:MAG: DNA polymerase III subunit alpha, partial [Bacteroidia bacterium]|nr:DNA polymerase III subunit alpha [Bacteroidia bacterium]
MPQFAHLHVHTQFSLLDGAAGIKQLTAQAKADGQSALAITDHGNMFGVPQFVLEAQKQNIKPIIGCEFYVAPGSRFDRTKADPEKERGFYHQVILAKNEIGYKNISKLSSLGFTEGFYYKPRIDKELLQKYSEGLIATTCCLASEVNQSILMRGEEEAEKVFKLYLDIFGEDYYIELQRHGIDDQEKCNEVLLRWAKKYNVKTIATNDVHYVNIQDAQAQDILLCLQTGKDFDDPNRMRFENNQFFLKSQDQINEVFKDVPEAVDNTIEIVSKIEDPKLTRDVLMPNYELPQGFTTEDEYLRDLTMKGAKQWYPEITEEIHKRIDYELGVIKTMGFAGYFLIVQDFVHAAKNQKVWVGPGRGSAAGSIVAFCTGITNIDPIKYNLLFERFLNPERVSMPDIDIDFDDEGRQSVIDYVVDRYGQNRVAQIITFGTMAAKSSIRDVARVLKLPLHESDKLAKLVPEVPGITLDQAFRDVKELREAKTSKDKTTRETLEFAKTLEGSARHTGIHAAGVIIAPGDLMEYLPVSTAKDSDLWVTQYDGKYVESVGMLKMDFLGLKTLTIIKDAIDIIKENRNVTIDIEKIPLDDEKTFELYQKGDTIGTFQFESNGMRQYLKDLKPTSIEDLIAMNALFRPGPMDFIPQFIDCKHGRKKIEYPHPLLEGILKNTYGIMVYQEQIMQTAQIMGGFSLGAADILRRAMGKKKASVMDEQREVFIKGAAEKNIEKKKAEEVFDVMAKFAEYGFNRSHSAAYSVLAYQTGYLKAHYPAEYMAAVLTNNMQDIKKVTYFIEESKRQGIPVLGPDVNESNIKFTVNKKGEIRFGLAALKGVGSLAAEQVIIERRENGPYEDIFDMVSRVNLRTVNKRSVESLIKSGAFDSFEGLHRAQYLHVHGNDEVSSLDKIIKTGSQMQKDRDNSQHSLFGEG